MNITGKKALKTVAAIGAGIALLVSTAPTANAARARDGRCDDYEFCLYHGPDFTGSVSDFARGNIPDYGSSHPGCYEYKGGGTGNGQCVKNNAKSARNRTHIYVVKIFYNSDYKGRNFSFNPGGEANLGALSKQNASHLFELVS